MLRGALEEPRVLVCDEAQWLPKLCFECLRHLWDDTASDLTIVFTGGNGCFEMLHSEPMLESRVYARQEAGRMPLDEVLTVIPAFPSVWAEGDPDLIAVCDQEAAHGNFRDWAKITHHLTTGLRETGRKRVDEELLRWTSTANCSPGSRSDHAQLRQPTPSHRSPRPRRRTGRGRGRETTVEDDRPLRKRRPPLHRRTRLYGTGPAGC